MSSNRSPDIEIYVKHLDQNDLVCWLEKHFKIDKAQFLSTLKLTDQKMSSHIVTNEQAKIELMITPNAAGKAYTSLWFKSDFTPWHDDKCCALSFLEIKDAEVRCSANSWHEEEEEASEQWLVLTRDGEKKVKWL